MSPEVRMRRIECTLCIYCEYVLWNANRAAQMMCMYVVWMTVSPLQALKASFNSFVVRQFHLAAVSLLTVVFLCAQFHFLSRLLSNLCPLSILQPLCVSLLSFSSASESGPSNTPSVPSSLISHPLLLHLMSSLVLLHWWIWHGAREMRVTAMCLLMAPCGDHYKLLQRADVLHRRYPISSNLSDGMYQ